MTGILHDERRELMREIGFEVCQLQCSRETREIIAVVYRYVGGLTEGVG